MKTELVLITLFLFLTFIVPASSTTITVSNKQASVNESFYLPINCTPSESIKAYEFKVQYDPEILSASSVLAGGFFKGKPTFSSTNCVINNTDGTIINIYDLTIGQGLMVTEPGVLVYIRFTAKQNGTSDIMLYDAGVTNDTRYLPLTVENGTVTISGFSDTTQPDYSDPSEQYNENYALSFFTQNLLIILVIGFVILFLFSKLLM